MQYLSCAESKCVFFSRNPSLNSTAFCWHSQTKIWRSRNILCRSLSLKFHLNIAHHLVNLNTPFWIEIKVNEETVSVLLIRWMEGGVHLSIMSQAFYYFFCFISLFIWSSFFSRQFRFSKARSCVKKTLSHFRLREKSIYLFTVYSRQNFSSSQLLWDNGTKGCKRTNSNPSKRFVIQWTLLNFYYNQLDYHPTRTRGLAFLPQPDTRNLFTPNIFRKDAI